MTMVNRIDAGPTEEAVSAMDAADDWVVRLNATGAVRDDAIRRLHALMLRAARFQVARMHEGRSLGSARLEEIVHSAADEAAMAVMARLDTFEGRSRFTTWAFKFGILNAAVEVRRAAWKHREVDLTSVPDPTSDVLAPDAFVMATELASAVRAEIDRSLTPHQRRVVVALLVEGIPVDVLAERLATNRNALYKTLHDARNRLRLALTAAGHLRVPASEDAIS
jgi:RNA polymerase sigma-70 factor (ECF subfamily)